jgi:hypothetical protein
MGLEFEHMIKARAHKGGVRIGKWMELENIILNEVSQAQKTKYQMFSLIWGL